MTETKVFLSYAREDRALAEQVRRKLRLLPVHVWSDEQLDPGERWQRVLRDRLKGSDLFLLIVTPNTLDSPWVLQELGAAWALGKRIVSVVSDERLIGKLPIELADLQVVAVDEIERLGDIIQDPVAKAVAQL